MIYFCLNPNMPGVSSVARAGEKLGLWQVIDVSFLAQVEENDLVILGAWDSRFNLALRRLKCRKARLVCSSLGQMEMSGIELQWFEQDLKLLERGLLDYIFVGSRDLHERYKNVSNLYHFPYPVAVDYTNSRLDFSTKIPNSVGIFLPPATRKNWQNQKAAVELARRAKPDIQLHTNERGWLSEQEYYDLLKHLKAVLSVTFVESMGYNCIQALEKGTLPIISPCIRDNLGLSGYLCVDNPDSAIKISEKLLEILNLDWDEYERILESEREKLKDRATENNRQLKKLLLAI